MAYGERMKELSELAWRRVDELLAKGLTTYDELTEKLGYANRTTTQQSHSHRGALPTIKQDAITMLYAAKTTKTRVVAKNDKPRGSETFPVTAWDDVREAAELLDQALNRVTQSVPGGLLSARVNKWAEAAEDILTTLE